MVSPASTKPSPLTSIGVAACLVSDSDTGFAVLVIVQATRSPTPSVTVAELPAAPLGSDGSVDPFRVQLHDSS